MTGGRKSNRGGRTQAAKVARSVVKQAMKREHGWTSTSQSGNLPAHRVTKIIQYKGRFILEGVGSTISIDKAKILQAIGSPTAEVKIKYVCLWDSPGALSPKPMSLEVRTFGESQRVSITPRQDKYVRGSIHPPQDDWIVNSSDFVIIIAGSFEQTKFLDVVVEARITVPEVNVNVPASTEPPTVIESSWSSHELDYES